jgi:prophage maintenance system killer protein
LNRPTAAIAVAINQAARESDEWFDDPDDIQRLEKALALTEAVTDPLLLAASVMFRVAFSQAFGEGNKRTALLLGIWVMDNNGLDRTRLIRESDPELAGLLVKAAAGGDVEKAIAGLLHRRAQSP